MPSPYHIAAPGLPRTLIVALILCSLPFVLSARVTAQVTAPDQTAVLTAVVTSHDTGEPIPDAEISVDGVVRASTDAQGRARVADIAPGDRAIVVSVPGYRAERLTVHFAAGATVEAELDLVMLIDLDPIVVETHRANMRLMNRGFYERERYYPSGTFLGPEEMVERARKGERFIDVFWGIPGLRIMPVWDQTRVGYTLVSSRGAYASLRSPCTPAIYLDGFRYRLFDRFELERLISLHHVAGMEVYVGSVTPPEYTGQSLCGAIVVWTH